MCVCTVVYERVRVLGAYYVLGTCVDIYNNIFSRRVRENGKAEHDISARTIYDNIM